MKSIRNALLQLLLVTIVGFSIGLIANAARSDSTGIDLSRNYFPSAIAKPSGAVLPPVTDAAAHPEAAAQDPPAVESTEAIEAKVRKDLMTEGIDYASHEDMMDYFQDPAYQQELIIFVDARDDKAYKAGHIPGAYQLDHYRPERYLDDVLPACRNAERVVVYCNGGSCEDSKFVARDLITNHGIEASKVSVYVGGIAAWNADGLAVEKGERLSGEEGYLDP